MKTKMTLLLVFIVTILQNQYALGYTRIGIPPHNDPKLSAESLKSTIGTIIFCLVMAVIINFFISLYESIRYRNYSNDFGKKKKEQKKSKKNKKSKNIRKKIK